ncbi:alkene reductase [Tropicimonas aquimaris]|uniref:Alkene reductase n=1 Tax=Tropicimonas aquimaris TaxID=914152 RepID=A0ABW3INT1_9RHOB
MTDSSKLFEPVRMGAVELPNRILMAPLTRNRAHPDGMPKELAATYYAQRASAGLLLTEATQISAMGKGYLDTPGIYAPEHVAAWKTITDAVHAAGGRIFVQLWHVGRISHSSLLPDGRAPVSSSAVRAEAQTFTANGFEPVSEPEALSAEGIAEVIADYRHAAEMAKQAGFDGVEIHAANGYLLDQFLQDGVNRREDAYGGSVENRMRLLSEVIDVVSEVWDRDRIGVRLSPLGQANDIRDSDPEGLFGPVYEMIGGKGLAYLHVVEAFPGSDASEADRALLGRLRARYDGFYMANGGYDGEGAAEAVASGHADAVSIGRAFIANPDLPERLRRGAALNAPDQSTFYGGGAEGYVDYPFLDSDRTAA